MRRGGCGLLVGLDLLEGELLEEAGPGLGALDEVLDLSDELADLEEQSDEWEEGGRRKEEEEGKDAAQSSALFDQQ